MNQMGDLGIGLIEIAIALLGFAFSVGASKVYAQESARRIQEIEEKQKDFITRQEYAAALADLKEQHRDLKDDIRRVLELLSKRGRS